MLIPYGTDAPIYYLPFATGAMIVANIAAFIGVTMLAGTLPEQQFVDIYSEMILLYGEGLRPWQWVTSNFMHAGFLHLLSNMFCLWGFGLVVEGKVGWWKFLAIYFGIGITQCGIEQTLMLFAAEGASLGASSIVYGLLAIAMVWAPQNEMNCVVLVFVRPIMFDMTLYSLAVFAVAMEVGIGMLSGIAMSSQVLHLMGVGVGFGIAVVMLKKAWVDCEGWDLFNVWKGTQNSKQDEEREAAEALLNEVDRKRAQARQAAAATPRATRSLESPTGRTEKSGPVAGRGASRAARAIEAGDPSAALAAYQNDEPEDAATQERELLKIIRLFHKQKQWSASVPAIVEYLRSFSTRDEALRLRLAHILIDVEKRPRQALKVLEKLNPAFLEDSDERLLSKLLAKAKKLKASVPTEPPREPW